MLEMQLAWENTGEDLDAIVSVRNLWASFRWRCYPSDPDGSDGRSSSVIALGGPR